MSSQSLNISLKHIAGKCDSKCSYAFKYSASSSTAKNDGIMLSLSYDSTSVPPVVYNEQKYEVGKIMITAPSIHMFNGATLPGEMIITHNPVKGGNALEVCIPFISSSETSSASQMLTDIIQKVAANAPSQGDSVNLNAEFNLQTVVPRKPYFSYVQGTSDWIVFGELDAIPLRSSTIDTLKQIIKPYSVPMLPADVFYNAKGPMSGVSLGDGIYISCQPTGSSNEETAVEYNKNGSSSVDFTNLLKSQAFQMLIAALTGCLLFVLIFYGINVFYKYLSSSDAPSSFTFT